MEGSSWEGPVLDAIVDILRIRALCFVVEACLDGRDFLCWFRVTEGEWRPWERSNTVRVVFDSTEESLST